MPMVPEDKAYELAKCLQIIRASMNEDKQVGSMFQKLVAVFRSLAQMQTITKQASKRTGTLRIGDYEMPTLLAITGEEQERGLMHIEPPAPVMSFIYARPQVNRFWMKNTPSPLDIVFSLAGKITGIYKGEPYSTAAIGDPYQVSDLIVEVPYLTCNRLGISIGDPIELLS